MQPQPNDAHNSFYCLIFIWIYIHFLRHANENQLAKLCNIYKHNLKLHNLIGTLSIHTTTTKKNYKRKIVLFIIKNFFIFLLFILLLHYFYQFFFPAISNESHILFMHIERLALKRILKNLKWSEKCMFLSEYSLF